MFIPHKTQPLADVQGIVPPTGVSGTLNNGVSFYRLPSDVATPANPSKVRVQSAESLVISDYNPAIDGVIDSTSGPQTGIFEGAGVASSWTLSFRRRSTTSTTARSPTSFCRFSTRCVSIRNSCSPCSRSLRAGPVSPIARWRCRSRGRIPTVSAAINSADNWGGVQESITQLAKQPSAGNVAGLILPNLLTTSSQAAGWFSIPLTWLAPAVLEDAGFAAAVDASMMHRWRWTRRVSATRTSSRS